MHNVLDGFPPFTPHVDNGELLSNAATADFEVGVFAVAQLVQDLDAGDVGSAGAEVLRISDILLLDLKDAFLNVYQLVVQKSAE